MDHRAAGNPADKIWKVFSSKTLHANGNNHEMSYAWCLITSINSCEGKTDMLMCFFQLEKLGFSKGVECIE